MGWIIRATLLAAASVLGSSSDSRVGVTGKVTYLGKPVAVGTITFLPAAENGIKCGGLIDGGAYKVEPQIGPQPGPHRVEIRWAKPTGKRFNEFGEELDVRQEGLPDKYHANSTLTADIKAGDNVIDFQLETGTNTAAKRFRGHKGLAGAGIAKSGRDFSASFCISLIRLFADAIRS